MKKSSKFRIVFATTDNEDSAKQIAKILISEKLAACCSIINNVHSVFEWDDEIVERNEYILMIKTGEEKLSELESRIIELHDDDVPEIIAVNIENGSEKYLNWMVDTIRIK